MNMGSSILYWTTVLLVILTTNNDAQFTSSQNTPKTGCVGESTEYNWTYINSAPVIFVEWKVNGSAIAGENVGASQPFTPVAGYIGRLSKLSNAQITLGSLTTSDVGTYTSEVNYNDGSSYRSHEINLSVYDILNKSIKIEQTRGNGNVLLKSSLHDVSITYTWKLSNSVIGIGFSLTVTINGNYSLCISGGRADCLSPLISPCASTKVEGLSSCDYSDAELFLCGFSVFLIEFVVTIVIVFLLKWKLIIGGYTKLKVIVSCAFILVALIIGIILGVVLLECSKRDLSLGVGIVLGFILAAAHLVTIYVIYKICEKEAKKAPPKIIVPSRFKEVSTFEKGEPVVIKIPFTGNPKPKVKWFRDRVELKGRNYVQEVTEHHAILTIKEANREDDGPYRLTLENELGTDSAVIKIQVNDDDERKGTPASTSNVEFTDRKASHVHLVTINGNKVDSQPKEPHRPLLEPHRSLPEPHRSLPEPHRPLPEPPATHPKQLEPLVSVPNDGATSSEKKKKKKKKKKKSEAREEPEDQ